jgi:hypothetical protein
MSKEEVKGLEKLRAISQITPIKERIRFFESKYGCTLGELKNKIKDSLKGLALLLLKEEHITYYICQDRTLLHSQQ